MHLVDLHLHTTFSDGRLTPTELIKLVRTKGLRVISITDHDSTEGLNEAFTASRGSPKPVSYTHLTLPTILIV